MGRWKEERQKGEVNEVKMVYGGGGLQMKRKETRKREVRRDKGEANVVKMIYGSGE